MYMYVCTYVCICMYLCVYIYIYIHIHAYIHTNIHTYIHTYIPRRALTEVRAFEAAWRKLGSAGPVQRPSSNSSIS